MALCSKSHYQDFEQGVNKFRIATVLRLVDNLEKIRKKREKIQLELRICGLPGGGQNPHFLHRRILILIDGLVRFSGRGHGLKSRGH